jgi:hypothetical protein
VPVICPDRREVAVDVFAESVRERLRRARHGLVAAAESSEPSALSSALDALADALRLARADGVAFPTPGEDVIVESELCEGGKD